MFLLPFLWLNRTSLLKAAAPYFVRVTSTATATTTPTYLRPGLATSTIITDIYSYNFGVGEIQGYMYLNLGVQFIGSSSPSSILKLRHEYANGADCKVQPESCDWYSEPSFTISGGDMATSSTITGNFHETVWPFASTTYGSNNGPRDRGLQIFKVPIYTRWVRTTAYLPIGSANGAVWMEALGVIPRQ